MRIVQLQLRLSLGGYRQDSMQESVLSVHVLMVESGPYTLESQLDVKLGDFGTWISDGERSVYEEFMKTISFKECRYEVHLPWKEPHPPLDDHFQLSLNRLTSLLRCLKQPPEILTENDAVIKEQLSKGIMEIVKVLPKCTTCHIMSCRSLTRQGYHRAPYSLWRLCKDTTGPSLNDCSYVGPPSGQYIFDVILRICVHNVALAGDIEKHLWWFL